MSRIRSTKHQNLADDGLVREASGVRQHVQLDQLYESQTTLTLRKSLVNVDFKNNYEENLSKLNGIAAKYAMAVRDTMRETRHTLY